MVFVIVEILFFFFQAEDGIRDLVRSRGLGDVYKRQPEDGRLILYHINGETLALHAGRTGLRCEEDEDTPVSYTHLTLPTIYSV